MSLVLKKFLPKAFVLSPSSTAFLANNPAPIKTFGFDVFVQDVMAAINIDPSIISYSDPSILEIIGDFLLVTLSNTFLKFEDASVRELYLEVF